MMSCFVVITQTVCPSLCATAAPRYVLPYPVGASMMKPILPAVLNRYAASATMRSCSSSRGTNPSSHPLSSEYAKLPMSVPPARLRGSPSRSSHWFSVNISYSSPNRSTIVNRSMSSSERATHAAESSLCTIWSFIVPPCVTNDIDQTPFAVGVNQAVRMHPRRRSRIVF